MEFQQVSDVFLQWFNRQTGASFYSGLNLADLRARAAGRGIVATQDIPADTALFTIPRTSIISVDNSELSQKLPHLFKSLDVANDGDTDGDDLDDLPDPWIELILVMIYEYLQGSRSRWADYFAVLPGQFDTLMFWSDEELNELQASAVKDKIGKDSANDMFRTKVLPVVQGNKEVFYPESSSSFDDSHVFHLAHQMGSLIMAYAFDLEKDDDDENDEENDGWVQDKEGTMSMGMVPMADMLNADAEFNAHLNHGEQDLTMRSLREIKAGEEVLNYYGPLPQSDLLRRYGYTSPKHARYDVVEVPWSLFKQTIDRRFPASKQGTIDDEDMEDSFVFERDAGEPDDTGCLTTEAQTDALPEGLEQQIASVVAPAVGIDISKKVQKADKSRLKTAVHGVIAATLTERLQQYGTSVSDDEATLASDGLSARKRMAIEVRLGEKRLLTEFMDFVRGTGYTAVVPEQGADVEMQEPEESPNDSRAAKRQKRS